MADIVLVQPKVGDWDTVRSHPSLPLGLLSAARMVTKDYKVSLIDTRLNSSWKKKLKEELEKNPLCVGITTMTGRQITYALEVAQFVKKNSKVPVVLGGIHGSLLPRSTLENEFIDILVIGEGEVSFLELVKALKHKSSLKDIPGVWYKENGVIHSNPKREFVNLDDLPELPLSLVELKKYLPVFKGRRTFYYESSRGCPNQCSFCYNAAYNNNRWRSFSASRVIKKLKHLVHEYGIGSIYVIDDNFFVDLKRAQEILQGIIDAKLDLILEMQGIAINSALKMDDDYLRLMVKVGVKKVHFGIETGSDRVLKLVNKRISIADVIKINKIWSGHNIVIQYNFMCGFPGETLADIRKTKDLVFQLMADNPNALISPLCPYTPYPGTALYDQALREGFITKHTLEDWQRTDYGDNLWESAQRKKFLSSLFFASMFLDTHRSKDMVDSAFLKGVIDIYRPIARFRVKHLFFKFMPELRIKNVLFR